VEFQKREELCVGKDIFGMEIWMWVLTGKEEKFLWTETKRKRQNEDVGLFGED
jgi:hypothetical protein